MPFSILSLSHVFVKSAPREVKLSPGAGVHNGAWGGGAPSLATPPCPACTLKFPREDSLLIFLCIFSDFAVAHERKFVGNCSGFLFHGNLCIGNSLLFLFLGP